MSNETKKQLEEFRRLIRDAHAETLKDLSAAIAAETEAREASVKQFREKAEVEAFGHRFHAKLLAAMKSGSTNVVDVLDAAMRAAGVGTTRPSPPALGPVFLPKLCDCAAHSVPHMHLGPPEHMMGVNTVVRGRPRVVAENIEFRADGTLGVKSPTTEKIAEPAPPAYSVEERKVRAGIARRFGPLLWPTWSQMSPLPEPEAVFNAVEVRIAAQALVEKTRQDIRDAALEEADRAGMSLRQYGTVADRYDSEGLKAAARTGWNAGANEVLAAIRALKSKPAPPSSASYGDFGWALQQLLAGKRVKQGDSPRSWRLREDGALVDQDGIVVFDVSMTQALARNWRLAE